MNKLTHAYAIIVIQLYLFGYWLKYVLCNIVSHVLPQHNNDDSHDNKIKAMDLNSVVTQERRQHYYDIYQEHIIHVLTLQRVYRGHRGRQVNILRFPNKKSSIHGIHNISFQH